MEKLCPQCKEVLKEEICSICGYGYACSSDSELSSSEEDEEEEEEIEEEESGDEEWKKELNFTEEFEERQKEEVKFSEDISWNKPIDTFEYFFDNATLEKITKESNNYGSKKLKNFVETTVQEWKYFFSIVIALSLISVHTKLSDIWSSNWMTRIDGICQRFPRDKFFQMKSALHLVDNDSFTDDEKKNKKSYKIAWLASKLAQMFQRSRNFPNILSVDEGMAPYKGYMTSMRQYLSDKPHKWGFRFWILCDICGYVFNFELYEGSKKNSNGEKITTKGLAKDVVIRLTDRVNEGSIIVTDNYYTSIDLAKELLKKKIYLVGTIKKNAKGLDKEWIQKYSKGSNKLEKGEWEWLMIQNISSFIWHDTKITTMISSYPGAVGNDEDHPFNSTIERKKKGEIIERSCPSVANIYNENMGGVDQFGSLRGRSPTYLASKKYWHVLFWYLVDMCLVNGYLNWKHYTKSNMSFVDYKKSICDAWSPPPGWWKKEQKKNKKRKIGSDPWHTPIDVPTNYCVVCEEKYESKAGEGGTKKQCVPRIVNGCEECSVNLCKGNCWKIFHSGQTDLYGNFSSDED